MCDVEESINKLVDIGNAICKKHGVIPFGYPRLEKYLSERNKYMAKPNILVKHYPNFKLKKKRVKNRSVTFVANRKVNVFLLKNVVPVSTNDDIGENGISYTLNCKLEYYDNRNKKCR